MKRISVILLVLLALAAFTAAAEKPKEFGGGDRVAELGPWVYFGDDAGRSEMWWLPEIGWYEFYPADGGYAWSWLEYYYFDGVYYMWDVALAYAFPGFNGVRAVYTYSPTDPFCLGPATLVNPFAPGLYHIAVDLYALQMLNVVTGYGFPIVPKDASGTPIPPANYINFRIDFSPDPGVQEFKEWMAPLYFLPGLAGGIPPAIYGPGGAALGRVNFVTY